MVIDYLFRVLHAAVTDCILMVFRLKICLSLWSLGKCLSTRARKRLSSLSSDKAFFDQAAPPYQKALDKSGYHYTLQYEPAKVSKRKNGQRNNILLYNPPFSKNTSTNIGHKFFGLVDKHFPNDHKLRKIFNRNTIKISYKVYCI